MDPQGPPPPYSGQNDGTYLPQSRPSSEDDASPPAYRSNDNAPTVTDEKKLDHSVAEPIGGESSTQATTSSASASSSPSRQTEPGDSSSSPLSFIKNAKHAYDDKKKAKEAARKVDYYQKNYGFVPKNVMSEAEWKRAKENAPKEKVPFKPKAKPYFGFLS